MSALRAAAAGQEVPTSYQGHDTFSAEVEGFRVRRDGRREEIKDRFASPQRRPGSGRPGLMETKVRDIDLGVVEPGERIELWIKLRGGDRTGYWSNLGSNIVVVGE